MKRYQWNKYDYLIEPFDNTVYAGDWCKWEDANGEIARLTLLVDKFHESFAVEMDTPFFKASERMRIKAEYETIPKLEEENKRLREALEKLARLGNGDRYGNSDGNMIARAALAP